MKPVTRTFGAIACASTAIFVLVASGETSGSSGSSKASGSTSHPPEDDVTISKCYKDELGSPKADVTILNNSSKESNYIVNITFESTDGSTQIDTSMVAVNNLGSGQKSVQEAVSFAEASSGFVCKVGDVTRYASGG